jgi:hypothetical protein
LKKYTPYILSFLLAGAIVALFLTGNNKNKKVADQRITLRKHDKIPYGTYVAYQTLAHLFPAATIYTNRDEPGYWDSLSYYEDGQALIIITGQFNPDESEMKKLIGFIEKGNDVFVSARTISYTAGDMLGCSVNTSDIPYLEDESSKNDSLHISLNDPPFQQKKSYSYPGKKLDATFLNIDETTTEVLGEDEKGRTNFIRLRAGKGNFYIHLAPLAFTNYFLLYKDNISYYEKVLSVISRAATKVVWDEYYLNKKFLDENDKKKGWFSVLSRYPGLKAALLTAIFTLLLYVLMEMRRKQRFIPKITRPKNDSLDFVRTIGRLYFDKGDHKNLSRKMSAYFLEHVRNKYKLPTGALDEDFVKTLQFKSGAEEHEIRGIVSFIRYLDDAPEIDHKQLSNFHKQLESFYKKA